MVAQEPVVRVEDEQAAMAAEKGKPAMISEKDKPAQKPYPGSFVENLGFRLIASNYQYQMSNLSCVLKEVGFVSVQTLVTIESESEKNDYVLKSLNRSQKTWRPILRESTLALTNFQSKMPSSKICVMA